jgi:hypothetical protein
VRCQAIRRDLDACHIANGNSERTLASRQRSINCILDNSAAGNANFACLVGHYLIQLLQMNEVYSGYYCTFQFYYASSEGGIDLERGPMT